MRNVEYHRRIFSFSEKFVEKMGKFGIYIKYVFDFHQTKETLSKRIIPLLKKKIGAAEKCIDNHFPKEKLKFSYIMFLKYENFVSDRQTTRI